MGDPDRRAVDKSEWLEAEAYGPVSAYCSAGPVASCTPDTPLSDILYHFEEFTGAPSRSFSRVRLVPERCAGALLPPYKVCLCWTTPARPLAS
jgi:hypothetical protein